MPRYIDADALTRRFKRRGCFNKEAYGVVSATIIATAPTADVAPVVHGRWTKTEDDYYGLNIVKCSVCREEWCFEVEDDVFDLNYHYCPNCGAKMDGTQ